MPRPAKTRPAASVRTGSPWLATAVCFLVGIGGMGLWARARRPPAPAPASDAPAASAPAASVASPEAKARLARAKELLEQQDLAAARTELEAAYALSPRSPEIAFSLGDLAYRTMKMEDAERYYREAAEGDPLLAAARANLALVLLELGQARAAAVAAREAIAITPDDPRFHALLGQCLLKLGNHQEAAELLEGALRKGVGGAERFAALARARDLLGQGDAALRVFEEAVRRDPQNPLVRYWRAECLRRLGRKTEADRELAVYQKCRERLDRMAQLEIKLAEKPRDIPTLLELARLRVERGVPSQAIVLVMRAEQIDAARSDVRGMHQLVERAVQSGKDVE
jgi:tetratricopeptide (TPR) repeat protein